MIQLADCLVKLNSRIADWRAFQTGNACNGNLGGDFVQTGQHYGVGLQYDITPALGLRGEVETYRKLGDDSTGGELKVDALSLGAILRF